MSTPPDQPSSYPYPNPQSAGGYPPPPGQPATPPGVPGQPGPQSYQGTGTGQPNPYIQPQPAPPGGPNPYAQPPTGQPGPYGPGVPPPGPPGAPVAGGGGKKALYALLGAGIASVLWGGALVGFQMLGDDEADLGAYALKDNLCAASDISGMKEKYPVEDEDPSHDELEHAALDSMSCNLSLKKEGADYSNAYLSINVELHKKTDPSAEFEARWESYAHLETKYKVEEVDGLGDKAYLVTPDPNDENTSRSVYLGVRDGWMTYTMSWSDFDTSSEESVSEITPVIKKDTEATLKKLSQ
ncbi:hypothetical protein [Wenjunlia vitaminophila]|uniref:hypothetical protein n=1 Tax=Wenjunlia vitaminophila TaxID=76728 RepID=UPI000ABAFEB6|nr:hypothetical protein [Wenjunlia vitaminophila]